MSNLNYELPGNQQFVDSHGLRLPVRDVLDCVYENLKIPLAKRRLSVLESFTHRGNYRTSLKSNIRVAAMDMSIDFMRACSYYADNLVACPSILVKGYLKTWVEKDPDCYREYMDAFGLNLAPHEMPLFRNPKEIYELEKPSTEDALANLRGWDASCLVAQGNEERRNSALRAFDSVFLQKRGPDFSETKIPGLFEVDFTFDVIGGSTYKSDDMGLWRVGVVREDGAADLATSKLAVAIDEHIKHKDRLDSERTPGVYGSTPSGQIYSQGYAIRFADGG